MHGRLLLAGGLGLLAYARSNSHTYRRWAGHPHAVRIIEPKGDGYTGRLRAQMLDVLPETEATVNFESVDATLWLTRPQEDPAKQHGQVGGCDHTPDAGVVPEGDADAERGGLLDHNQVGHAPDGEQVASVGRGQG